ncbi:acetyl-CoA synthetase [Streptomyces sp. NPDC057582]|uniref:acetyl-CoA synthetase n=1 Tax=unclassified Streptomyces TaxID=2593676 RepID=UPI0036B9AEC6
MVALVLRPRTDDWRRTMVHSSAPVLVLASGWRVDADGTGQASLWYAGVRAGAATVTVLAKAPDVAGAAWAAFTSRISVVPYPKEG